MILRFSFGDGITELLSGEVDADRVPSAILPTVAGDPRFRIYHSAGAIAGQAVYWKSDHAILGDPMVRRALTHAIDRRTLHHVLNYPDDLPIFDAPHTPDQYRRWELLEPLSYDPASEPFVSFYLITLHGLHTQVIEASKLMLRFSVTSVR